MKVFFYQASPFDARIHVAGHRGLVCTLEPTNDAYAIAKIAGLLHVQGVRRRYGASFISAMPTNLSGPGDTFDLETSHVLPAMICKFHDAMSDGRGEVMLWGTGSPRRNFLHVDDLANAVVTLLERYDEPGPIKIGVGENVTKPDGTPRKLLDVSRIRSLGRKAQIPIEGGIESTYDWFQRHVTARA